MAAWKSQFATVIMPAEVNSARRLLISNA